VRRYRQAAALSQEALAERAGLSADAVSVIERGRRGAPRPDTVMLLARALGLEGEARSAFVASAHALVPTHRDAAHDTPSLDGAGPVGSARLDLAPLPPFPLEPTPLPVPLTGFVGREREVAEARARLLEPQTRLLTLTGPGGTGKTRLALEVARAVEVDFPDGVAFVPLATLTDPDLVPSAITQALGLREHPGQRPLDLLRSVLQDRRLLLVLDNCEQVAAAASQFADLLMATSGVRILATSRARLAVAGERLYPVLPLGLPTPEQARNPAALGTAEAVRLFVLRAQDALPEFAVDAGNAAVVGAICARLDGLPLAIELAAARIRHMPPPALLKRLEGSMALLTGGPRDAPERQRTLRETIAWSYVLLDEEGKALFRRLSVFVGGWTLAAAEAVCAASGGLPALEGDTLLALSTLADQSLVVVENDRAGEPRFQMLQTVRAFAWERLAETGEREAMEATHAAYLLSLAEAGEPALQGADQGLWLAQLEREHDNLRAVLRWAQDKGELETGLRLAGALRWFWLRRGYLSEGRRWLEGLLARAEMRQRSAGAPAVRARALQGAGGLAWSQGDYARATVLLEESLALSRDLNDKPAMVDSLVNLGIVAYEQGEYARAMVLHEESLALCSELGDKRDIAYSLINLGIVAYEQGDYARATVLLEESLALSRGLNDKRGTAYSLHGLGGVAYEQGDYARATALHQESLALCRELGDKRGIVASLEAMGRVATAPGTTPEFLERAARLLGAAAELREVIGTPLPPSQRAGYERIRTAICSAMGGAAWTAAWAAGRTLALEAVVVYALEVDLGAAQ
jgi:predicted ATPase/transcriptional regulator with XRE-family HTH domain/Tfp pilus assembly protein PilF